MATILELRKRRKTLMDQMRSLAGKTSLINEKRILREKGRKAISPGFHYQPGNR